MSLRALRQWVLPARASSLWPLTPDSRHARRLRVAGIIMGLLLLEALLSRVARGGSGLQTLILFLGAAVYVILAARFPWLLMVIVAGYAPFAALLRFGGLSNVQSFAKDLAVGGLVVFWAVRALLQRRKLAGTPLNIPLVIYLVFLVISALRGPTALRGILELKILAFYIPLYFWVVNEPPTKKQIRVLLWALMAVTMVTVAYGWSQWALHGRTLDIALQVEGERILVDHRGGYLRVFSTLSSSGVFSMFLAMSMTLALALMRSASSVRLRLLIVLIIAAMALALGLTLTRIGWLCALLGIGIVALLSPTLGGRLRLFVLLCILVVFVLAMQGSVLQDLLHLSFSGDDVSYQTRASMIKWGIRMIALDKLEGCGLGSQGDAAQAAFRVTKIVQPAFTCFWQGYPVTGADTLALAIGVQTGILGFLSYCLVVGVLCWQVFQIHKRLADPFLKSVAASLAAFLGFMAFSSFWGSSPQAYPVVDLYFWLFAGIAMSLERVEEQSRDLLRSPA